MLALAISKALKVFPRRGKPSQVNNRFGFNRIHSRSNRFNSVTGKNRNSNRADSIDRQKRDHGFNIIGK